MQTLSTRRFAADDYARWYPLWREYQRFYEADLPSTTSALTWQRLLDPAEPMQGLFALDGERCVGFVHCIEHRSCWTPGNYLYLQDLYVAEDCRGRGAGRLLIEKVYEIAKVRGCSRVHWLTQETNTQARVLYDKVAERSGFIQYRRPL
ncbi:MAG: GNAT family N-acetyltransferase [Pseudomonadota bacterium]